MSEETGQEKPDDGLQAYEWGHPIPFGVDRIADGKTPLSSVRKQAEFIPEDLSGKSVLDIGAREGYFSFVAERRGADLVVGTDIQPKNARKFRFARQELAPDVEYVISDIMQSVFTDEFDVVICYGLLYHLAEQNKLLDRLAEMTAETLCLETAVIPSPFNREWVYHHDGATNRLFTHDEHTPTVPWVRRELSNRGFTITEEMSQPDRSNPIRTVYDRVMPLAQHRLLPGRYVVTATR